MKGYKSEGPKAYNTVFLTSLKNNPNLQVRDWSVKKWVGRVGT